MTDGPIFKDKDGSQWRWNAFRSELRRLAAVSTAEQVGTSEASEPNPSVEVERLREALEPFAACADTYADFTPDEAFTDSTDGLTVGECRKARAALSRKHEPGTPGGEGE